MNARRASAAFGFDAGNAVRRHILINALVGQVESGKDMSGYSTYQEFAALLCSTRSQRGLTLEVSENDELRLQDCPDYVSPRNDPNEFVLIRHRHPDNAVFLQTLHDILDWGV